MSLSGWVAAPSLSLCSTEFGHPSFFFGDKRFAQLLRLGFVKNLLGLGPDFALLFLHVMLTFSLRTANFAFHFSSLGESREISRISTSAT